MQSPLWNPLRAVVLLGVFQLALPFQIGAQEPPVKAPVRDVPKPPEKPALTPEPPKPAPAEPDADDETDAEEDEETRDGTSPEMPADPDIPVAQPVNPDQVQIFGWRESILIDGIENSMSAKLDTGALTNSLHCEEAELFERDGKKWVRFVVTDPRNEQSPRTRLEAALVRIAKIKEPGGESVPRHVVRLEFTIGEQRLRGEFTLDNRSNMLNPILLGRTTLKELGWIDPTRTDLAKERIFR